MPDLRDLPEPLTPREIVARLHEIIAQESPDLVAAYKAIPRPSSRPSASPGRTLPTVPAMSG